MIEPIKGHAGEQHDHRADDLKQGDHDHDGDHIGQDQRHGLLEALVEAHYAPFVEKAPAGLRPRSLGVIHGVLRSWRLAKEVVDAIRAVHSGKRYLSRPLVDSVIDHFLSRNDLQDPLERLSSRERQVLQMLAEGHSVSDIACTLSLSRKTVETYRARMLDKLGIRDLASLIKFAIQQGIVSFE